jgi:hypothetical protein
MNEQTSPIDGAETDGVPFLASTADNAAPQVTEETGPPPPKPSTPVNIPFPPTGPYHLRVRVGACRLRIRGGAQDAWVSGVYNDPSGALPCRVTHEDGVMTISQDITPAELTKLFGNTPEFDLAFGAAQPYTLTIETGASEAIVDLGGLPLLRFSARQGAGKMTLDFSTPNPQAMEKLDIDAGAVDWTARNLANANFGALNVASGAASFHLDFGGVLRRDGQVKITTALCAVEVRVPAQTPVRIMPESVLGGVEVGDGFMKQSGAFCNMPALSGRTPALTIQASVTLGGLDLALT